MAILNNPKVSQERETEFRNNAINKYAATEEALILRYVLGEKTLIAGKDFSFKCLDIYLAQDLAEKLEKYQHTN